MTLRHRGDVSYRQGDDTDTHRHLLPNDVPTHHLPDKQIKDKDTEKYYVSSYIIRTDAGSHTFRSPST